MTPSELLAKVHQLETEIDKLKQEFPPPGEAKKFLRGFKRGLDGVLGYWVPLALIIGLLVNWWFGVGVFEEIKNIGITKTSSNYYCQIGARLMEHAQFKAAEDAFTKALEINSSNIAARHGLMKAQVLQPVSANADADPIVVEQKLAYLRDPEIFGADDHILYYWEGILRRKQSSTPADLDKAVDLFKRSITKRDTFMGSHLELGNTYLIQGEIDQAVAKYEEITRRDSKFAPAQGNLGYCRLVLSNFEPEGKKRRAAVAAAGKILEEALKIAPSPEIQLHRGDAFLYEGQFPSAEVFHLRALKMVEQAGDKTNSRAAFEIPVVFLPVNPDDSRSRGPAIDIATPDDLKAFILYSLSFDRALRSDYLEADKYFSQAKALDPKGDLVDLVVNKIQSLINALAPQRVTRRWMVARVDELCKGDNGCKPPGLDSKEKENKNDVKK